VDLIIIEEVKNKTRELHQQVEELSNSMMLLIMKISNISGTIRSIKEFIPFLSNRIQTASSATSEAERVLETIPPQCKHYYY
jgi:prefoldin subunit 5